uniref:ABC1 atypical kinase-like domain-containing protein n=1 Tax=viral metagenome TaxID=1070528 RepID=A0A6C0I3W0_9ZZZZ
MFKNIKINIVNAFRIIKSYSSAIFILTTETVQYKLGYTEYNNYIKQLALKLSRENVFYIKFFQAACTIKSPLLTDELTSFLTTFTDNVPYSSYEIDHDSLQSVMNEFSVSIKKPFVPIKSGTISLIFEGTMQDKPVIIKCKRIGIDNKIHNAIFHMNHLISISMLIPHIKNLNVHEIYSENKQSVLDQLSFENEVSNIELFYSKWNKPGLDYIKIPRVYSNVTMKVPSVIIMERIFGKTITQIDTDDKDKYALLLAKFNFKSVFYDGIYHGDFHPGNVFFLKENKVVGSDDDNDDDNDDDDDAPYTYKLGIIDFGIIGTLTRELQNVIYNLFHNLYEKNHVGVAHCMIDNLIEPKDILTPESKKELVEIISSYSEIHFGKENYKFVDAEDMITINKLLYKYGVQFSKEFCKVELSFAISDSVCKLLSNRTTYIDQLLNIFSNPS